MDPKPHPDSFSPKVGFWPNPTQEDFRRPQEPKGKKKYSANFIYNYEEELFYFSGSNVTPIYNKFDCLSDEVQDSPSDSEFVSNYISDDFLCNNIELRKWLFNDYLEDVDLFSNQTNFNVPTNYENANYMYTKIKIYVLVISAVSFP